MTNWRPFTIVVHGESGSGKTWLGDTVPAPRLILDAEVGTRFTRSQKVYWDPLREPPPAEGSFETCIVRTWDWDTVVMVFNWLNSGQHPFRSVVWDSLTEIQKRCLDTIAGTSQPRIQDWGELLRVVEKQIRDFRDLTEHRIKPIEVVQYNTITVQGDDKKWRPMVHGALARSLPQFVDVVGFLYTSTNETGNIQRTLMVQPYPGIIAKDRTDRLPPYLINPSIVEMQEAIYG